jgi:Flp pilus assembly pilin Flp
LKVLDLLYKWFQGGIKVKKWFRTIIQDEKGINTVEIVVLVAVAIGLALIFREQLLGFINKIFNNTFDASRFAVPTPTP